MKGTVMHKTLAIAAIALSFAGANFAITHAAHADSVRFNVGDVAIGYSDGYWDRGHHWHGWRNDHDREAYRADKHAEYHEWKHDRDKDMGWHERHF
jgi:hypothetical protein